MPHIVMPGRERPLDPGIHVFLDGLQGVQHVDGWNKSGHDGILDFGTDFDQ
jgi:hypothetical protein